MMGRYIEALDNVRDSYTQLDLFKDQKTHTRQHTCREVSGKFQACVARYCSQ
jgi:hypothetical protein